MELRVKGTGMTIKGTLERLSGCAGISEASLGADGTFDIEYDGGTEIYYDEQETVTGDNCERIFLGDDGQEYLESALELYDPDAEEDDDCDCADRSWYGEDHDSACPVTLRRNEIAAEPVNLEATEAQPS